MKLAGDVLANVDPRAAAAYMERVEHPPRRGMPPEVVALDHSIRTWLDRDDIATWIKVAEAAGYAPDPLPPRMVSPGFPVRQDDEE